MNRSVLLSITLIAILLVIGGCNTGIEKVDEVSIHEMESFSEVKEDTLVTFTDENEIKKFKKAISGAKKQPGVVDMADPHYKVELGGKSFFLWLSQDHGTIMKVENTNTIYSLKKKSVSDMNELLN
ncbi:hypothetical protein ABE021_06250 [Sporosarcina gallistercoris]|uniref:hypothetical protein n=1 Tax=Sporosarcina gallistercoris TaxID=2762245 RepID=UPI003D28F1FE